MALPKDGKAIFFSSYCYFTHIYIMWNTCKLKRETEMINLTLSPIPGMIAFDPSEDIIDRLRTLFKLDKNSDMYKCLSKEQFDRLVVKFCGEFAVQLGNAGHRHVVVKKHMPNLKIFRSACRGAGIVVEETV